MAQADLTAGFDDVTELLDEVQRDGASTPGLRSRDWLLLAAAGVAIWLPVLGWARA
jgi:hypothetical protein